MLTSILSNFLLNPLGSLKFIKIQKCIQNNAKSNNLMVVISLKTYFYQKSNLFCCLNPDVMMNSIKMCRNLPDLLKTDKIDCK